MNNDEIGSPGTVDLGWELGRAVLSVGETRIDVGVHARDWRVSDRGGRKLEGNFSKERWFMQCTVRNQQELGCGSSCLE